MKKSILSTFVLFFALGSALAADVSFHRVKLADARGKQADASLTFSDGTKSLIVRMADRDVLNLSYDRIDKFAYEYSKKHRITQGAIVMVASLGAGAVVMLTSSKSHWLYIYQHPEAGSGNVVVLRMDKKDYKDILDTARTVTGKPVEMLGNQKHQK